MGKFGKKVHVSDDLSSYLIGVMGPSGFGKTTLMYQACEKEFGSDGYIILDMGIEDGTAALENANSEKINNWKKMIEVVDDIVEHKDTYPDLKVVIIDTLDAAFDIAESYTVRQWNVENKAKPGFVMATSINSVEGGFGKGLDRVIATIQKEINRLKSVGVGVWWTAHVKEKDQVDLFTGTPYTTLTANMSSRYFNSIKNSTHIVAFGYFDRSIETREVGEENPVTKKKRERKEIVDEVRKIKFRDDALVADAKSRFEGIVDEIPLNCDAFIKAIKEAIVLESKKTIGGTPSKVGTAPKKAVIKEEVPVEDVIVDDDDDLNFDIQEDTPAEDELALSAEEICSRIKSAFAGADKDAKVKVKQYMKDNDIDKIDETVDVDDLSEMLSLLM